MIWILTIGWINTILFGALGIAVLLTRRWKHLRWFPFYILIIVLLTVIQALWFFTHEFSYTKRIICGMLALGAASEVLRKDADKKPRWRWFALLGLTVIPFIPMNPVMLYYLPLLFLYIGFALELPTALRIKNAPLLGWSVYGIATVISDGIKLIKPIEDIVKIGMLLDTMIFTAMVLIMFTGLLWPEIERWVLPQLKKLGDLSGRPVFAQKKAVENETEKAAYRIEVPIVPRIEKHKPENFIEILTLLKAIDEKLAGLAENIAVIDDKILVLQEYVKSLSGQHTRLTKMFLNPIDVAVFLGTDEVTARQFVDIHNIPKLMLSEDADNWLVFRADVEDALEDPE